MSALAEIPPEMSMVAADDFAALEERVMRTVELLKNERERRSSAEEHVKQLAHQIEERAAHASRLEEELSRLKNEREIVRQRMERLLKQLDEV
jgi:predicted nuclease with TOPRIM domain